VQPVQKKTKLLLGSPPPLLPDNAQQLKLKRGEGGRFLVAFNDELRRCSAASAEPTTLREFLKPWAMHTLAMLVVDEPSM